MEVRPSRLSLDSPPGSGCRRRSRSAATRESNPRRCLLASRALIPKCRNAVWHETCSASGQTLRLPGTFLVGRIVCVEPYCAVERGAWVHAVAGVGARTPVRARVQLTLCRSLSVVRATARARHTDSDRVVRREVLERSLKAVVKSPPSACWPAACRVRGWGHTVCVRRAVWHACAPLALDAYDTSGGSPSHALAARRLLSVRSSAHRLRTLTPDHRHLSGTSHPYTTRSCSRAPSLPRSGRLLHFPLAAESVESLEAASDATRVGALHTRSVFWLGLGCRSGLSRMRTRRQRT